MGFGLTTEISVNAIPQPALLRSGGVYVNWPDVELYVTSPLPAGVGLGLTTEISVRAIPLPPLDVKSGAATHLVLARSHFNT